ncbi:hypothetical protein [Pseudomonas putida]
MAINSGKFDRPHNHRWPYAAYVLTGGYEHYLYSVSSARPASGRIAQLEELQLEFAEHRPTGTSYFLKENLYHSIGAAPGTVTLIIRGPATKGFFTVMDRPADNAWVQRGSALESASERAAKRMADEQYETVVQMLETAGVI